jgi:plasmid stability protein
MIAMRAVLDPSTPGAITDSPLLSFHDMKQLLLRIPEDLHRRLADRARGEGRSMNALATESLEALLAADEPRSPRAQLRAKAASLGLLRSYPEPERRLTPEERAEIIASTRGKGPTVQELIDDQRGRLDHLR